MCLDLIAHKDQGHESGPPSIAHKKALQLIGSHATPSRSGIIGFKDVFKVLGWLYHLTRNESKTLIKEMEAAGLVEFVPFHGVRIKERPGHE